MAALHEEDLITRIQRRLSDASTATFATADIHISLIEALSDVAEFVPNVALATVTTQEGTAFINIGGISSLLYGENENSFESVEFPIDQNPQKLRNFSVQGSAMLLDIDFLPAANEDVRLLIRKPHLASGSASASLTLTPKLEQIIIPYVAGKIAVDFAVDSIGGISIGGQRTSEQFEAWGQRRVERAERDLSRMRKARMNIEYPRAR